MVGTPDPYNWYWSTVPWYNVLSTPTPVQTFVHGCSCVGSGTSRVPGTVHIMVWCVGVVNYLYSSTESTMYQVQYYVQYISNESSGFTTTVNVRSATLLWILMDSGLRSGSCQQQSTGVRK